MLGTPLPRNDCNEADKIQGVELWEHSSYEAGIQQWPPGVPPWVISRAVGVGKLPLFNKLRGTGVKSRALHYASFFPVIST